MALSNQWPTLEEAKLCDLNPRANNARTHTNADIDAVAESIRKFGMTFPILVDGSNRIIAGHCRYEAAKRLGLETVPILRRTDMNDAQIKLYMLTDNRLAENAGWDRAQLAIELQEIIELADDFDLEVTDTGFELVEVDLILQEATDAEVASAGPDEADAVPDLTDTEPVTRLDDVWIVGRHRLICGDSKQPETYDDLMDGETAQLVFTDPPYNLPVDGHVSGKGKVKHREFQEASGEMTSEAFVEFLRLVMMQMVRVSVDGAIHFICMDWRHAFDIMTAGKDVYTELKNMCVWAKTNGGMGSLYRSRHELIFVYKAGKAKHINNVQLGRNGRNRTNLWDYAGVNSFGHGRDDALAMHPTVKPVAMIADAILDCSNRGGIILDPFAGSGSTLIAAERTGRRGYGIEIDPLYCDVILTRLKKVCGLDAVLADTGETFAQVRTRREAEQQQIETTMEQVDV